MNKKKNKAHLKINCHVVVLAEVDSTDFRSTKWIFAGSGPIYL